MYFKLDGDVTKGLDICRRSLVRRLITEKLVNSRVMQAIMVSIWNQPKEFMVVEIAPRVFQLFFGEERGLIRVLKGSCGYIRILSLFLRDGQRTSC
ncbi:hypothetical protein L6164_008625 [Bauhinia variegata]|uniref:Uncharacterized protein n=1 Tax=Bauhinia variegata TaxID=167791 RepID=A0ACB9PH30_BAUVA|nr:hypothetical protein L6164_008625 [Bauhinia variegata]